MLRLTLDQQRGWDTNVLCSWKFTYNFWLPKNLTTNSLLLTRSITNNKRGQLTHILFIYGIIFFKFINLFGETERVNGGGAARESQAGSLLPAQTPMWGSNSWTVRSWPELTPSLTHNQLSHPSAPIYTVFLYEGKLEKRNVIKRKNRENTFIALYCTY